VLQSDGGFSPVVLLVEDDELQALEPSASRQNPTTAKRNIVLVMVTSPGEIRQAQ